MLPFRKASAELIEKIFANIKKAKDDRLAILAVELGLSGAQVLQEDFGFTQQQAALWLDKMLDRAKVNRSSMLAVQAIKQIDGESR